MLRIFLGVIVLLMGTTHVFAQPGTHPGAAQPRLAAADANSVTDEDADAEDEDADSDLPAAKVAWLELSGPMRDGPPPYAWVGADEAGLNLRRLVTALRKLAGDDKFTGLVIRLDEPMLELSQTEEITAAIKLVRDAGKTVAVVSESYDMSGYLLACAADKIILQRKGQIELHGLAMEEMYLAGLLEKVGAKADFLQVGKFKGADEQLTRVGPSEAWSENIDALLTDLYGQIVGRIAAARGLKPAQVEKLFADCWTLTDDQYIKRRLVDYLAERDLVEVSGELFGDDFEWVDLVGADVAVRTPDNPFAFLSMLMQSPAPRIHRDTIAVIHGRGPITSGDSGVGDGLFGGDSIGSRTLVEALGQAKDDERIKGVIVRIDSPGGSALASEVIWQAVRECGDVKPVFVSIGSMAASGGYYIACAGHEIYVSPATIVGSIGVVGGKIVMGGLYEKIGVTVTRRSRGPMSDMFNSVEPFTPEQRAALEAAFERTYEQFTDRVSTGRGNRIKDIPAVAQGRLFTGKQAVENGLADRVGGIEIAIADLAEQLNLEPGKYDVVNLPPPMSLGEFFQQTFGGVNSPLSRPGAGSSLAATVREVLGEQAWREVQPVLGGLMQLRTEHVLLLMPSALIVR